MSFYVSQGGAVDQNLLLQNFNNPFDVFHQIVANPGTSPQPAFDPTTPGRYMITKTGAACVIVLPAPVAGRDDGLTMQFVSNTAFAHQIQSSGNFQDGGGHANQLQFPAQAGAVVELVAFGGKWNVISQQGAFTDT